MRRIPRLFPNLPIPVQLKDGDIDRAEARITALLDHYDDDTQSVAEHIALMAQYAQTDRQKWLCDYALWHVQCVVRL